MDWTGPKWTLADLRGFTRIHSVLDGCAPHGLDTMTLFYLQHTGGYLLYLSAIASLSSASSLIIPTKSPFIL